MPYLPNFCAECGTRIIRESWHLWTSRAFCAACAKRLQKSQLIRPATLSLFLVALGALAGYTWRKPAPPVIATTAPQTIATTSQNSAPPLVTVTPQAAINTLAVLPPDANTIVSLCGARTKKGTPCTRRVQGTSRCWQHTGALAMLPPEKLRVK